VAEKSEQDVRQEVEELLQEIEGQRETAQQQGLRFAARSEEELYRKVRGEESSSSPFIYSSAADSGGPPGTNVQVWFTLFNPDATIYYPVLMSLFFGAASFLDDIGEGLSGRDQRWPYLHSRPVRSDPGKAWTTFFNYSIPYVPRPSIGIGNGVLWGGNFIDKGRYFDRCFFDITVL